MLSIRRLRDITALLATPVGRRQVALEASLRLWPAVAPLVQAYRAVAFARTPVVVVVGSQGKSTTVRAVRAALGLPGHRWVDFNAGTEIAVNLALSPPRRRAAVLEVGIGGKGQMQGYASRLKPTMVVVTCIGTEHHGSLGSKGEIRAEKAKMVEALPASGTVFLNADDEHVLWMRSRTAAECVTFGLSPSAAIRASELRAEWPEGIAFTLHFEGRKIATRTRFVSVHLVRAFLAAVGVAVRLGEPLPAVLERLSAVTPAPRRLEPRRLRNGAWLLRDEYKSSLETIDAALDVMEAIPGRRFVVLGEVSEPPGSQGPIYRRLGERIAGFAHAAVFVGGNFDRYRAGARAGGMSREHLLDAGRSWRVAAEYLKETLREGDVVLVKGRDTQRLDRISLSLLGRDVQCSLTECPLPDCDRCPLLTGQSQAPRAASARSRGSSRAD